MNGAGSAFEGPIRIEYRPSPRVFALEVLAHLGALAAVAMSGISLAARAWTAALVFAALVRRAQRWWRERHDPAPPLLLLDALDEWRLQHAGRDAPMSVGCDCVALPSLIILHLRNAARANRFFVLAPDNVPQEVLRRLRVRLRYPLAAEPASARGLNHPARRR